MSNLSDKELDRLSREAADLYEPGEDNSSWEKLAAQLDGEIVDKPPAFSPRFGMKPVGYGALILFLAGASYFLIKSEKNKKYSTLKNQATTTTRQNETKQSGNPENKVGQETNAVGNKTGIASHDATAPATTETLNAAKNAKNDFSKEQKLEPDHAQAGSLAENKARSASTTNAPAKDVNTTRKLKPDAAGENNSTVENDRAGSNADETNHAVRGNAKKIKSNRAGLSNNSPVAGKGIANNDKLVKDDGINNAGAAATLNKNNKNKIVGTGNNKPNSKHANKENENGEKVTNNSNNVTNESTEAATAQPNNVSGKPSYDLEFATLPGLISLGNSSPDISDSSLRKFIAKAADSNSDASNQNSKPNQALHISNPLKIGIMFAPDYSNVRSANNSRLSSNIGITLGYEFTDRWSVNTGLIYTVKRYGANGGDFHGWAPASYLDYVKGDCHMIEIPLSLRYEFSTGRKSRFFVNGGLSSYLMKSEAYTFYYHTYWGSTQTPEINYNSSTAYWLSIASLSVGMEQRLSKNISLQVEPFLKIPLTGIGIGDLQLNSYGVMFSLRYAPVLKKTRH